MLIRLYALIIFQLSSNFIPSLGQEWLISRKHEPNDFKRYDKLNCATKFTDEIIQLIIDYALWRNIGMLYIVDESINSGCNIKAIRRKMSCFLNNGLMFALQTKFRKSRSPGSQAKKVLVISFTDNDTNLHDYLKQINLLCESEEHFKLLSIYQMRKKSNSTEIRILNTFRSGAFSISADIVIAALSTNSKNTEKMRILERCHRSPTPAKSFKKVQVETILPFNNTQYHHNQTNNITLTDLCLPSNDLHLRTYCMLQLYKIRMNDNASLVVRPLGYWNYEDGTRKLKPFQSTETRIDFFGYPLIFGKKQFSQDAHLVSDENLIEDDNDAENIQKISEYIASFLNARQVNKMYATLGLKAVTGNWSGLLGAVVSREVDIGLDSVIKVPERYNDMVFTHDIMESVRNIYLKPEQSHSARDIFLAPFEPKLIGSVLLTGFFFVIAMAAYIITRKIQSKQESLLTSHLFAISDAVLWIAGVFTMQGTQIQPRSYSGNLIVFISLLFALIIYNSYSAFITSMLSVKITQIKTVDDLLRSDYDIGYARNTEDEIFLRSMNESQLNQIYLRGYLHNNINNVTEGLLKSTKGNYGFFATGHVARKQFLKISGHKCKYEIMEIPVPSTVNSIGFPMSHLSPYRKLINLCLIRMMEGGIHQYITSLINPKLPQCDQKTTYQSARINDLITSFGLLGLGILTGTMVILLECFWKKKKRIYAKLQKKYKRTQQKLDFVR